MSQQTANVNIYVFAAGEAEFQSLTPPELRVCRNIVAVNGQRVSELDSRCDCLLHKQCRVAQGRAVMHWMPFRSLQWCTKGCTSRHWYRRGPHDRRVLASLYKRELVYLDVPIHPSDHVSIPPLEVRRRCMLN